MFSTLDIYIYSKSSLSGFSFNSFLVTAINNLSIDGSDCTIFNVNLLGNTIENLYLVTLIYYSFSLRGSNCTKLSFIFLIVIISDN